MLATMASRVRGLALLPLLWVFLGCPTPEEHREEAREEARAAIARGDRAAALQQLARLRELEPAQPDDLLELAELLTLAGEAPQALRSIEEGLRRWPESDDLRIALARTALLVSDSSAAVAALSGVAPESERHADALVLRAQAELRLGDFDRAVATLDEAERRYPDRPEARVARIGALLSEQRIAEARRALAEARTALGEGEAEEALRGLEISLEVASAEQDPEAAGAALRALAAAHPDDPRVWEGLATAMLRARQAKEAAALVEEAIRVDPDRLFLYGTLADLYRAADRPEDARDTIRALIERAPSPSAHLALAQHDARVPAPEGEPRDPLDAVLEGLEAFPEDPLLLRTRAELELEAGSLERAGETIAHYGRLFPDDPNAEYLRARQELAEGDAEAAAQRLRELMPRLDRSFTQYWLGRALEALGEPDAAWRRFQLAAGRDPRDPALYPPIIWYAERRGDWREVAQFGERLALLAPDRFAGWSAWATGLIRLENGARAEFVARAAAQRFPELDEASLLLARALRTAGKDDEALETLDALEARSDAPGIAAERVLILGLAGRVAEGIELGRRGLERNPEDRALLVALASLEFKAGHAEEGTQSVDRALALDPDDAEPLAIRARFRAATGQLDGAREDCERYLERHPDDPGMQFVYGAVLGRLGRTDDAIAAHRRAAEFDPKAFAPRNNLAYLLADRDLEGALVAAQEAYALRPESAAVMDTLGWLYLRKGLVDRASALLERAHAADPELAEIQLHLALARREAGRTEEARSLLTELSERKDAPPAVLAQAREALGAIP